MLVNLKSLSAKELYELAQQKEQEEAKLSALRQQIAEKGMQRIQLVSKQRGELAAIDTQIQELTSKRKALADKSTEVIKALDDEVYTLKAEYQALKETSEKQNADAAPAPVVEEHAASPEVESAASAPAQAQAQAPIDEETRLAKAIIGTFKGRTFISEGLLKEKLTAQGFANPPINAALNAMIKQKSLVRKGGGNYVLGTIPAALR